jgi:23S rRNA pseudouridine1911/1915/1917 synthase
VTELTVAEADAGIEALALAADAFPDVTTAALRRLFKAREVLWRGRACGAGQTLDAGEVLSLDPSGLERIQPTRLAGLVVLHEEPDLLCVDKPAGVAVEAERGADERQLLAGLLHLVGERSLRPRLVHRLDKGTSGVLLVALTRSRMRALTRQFSEREVRKEYLALVRGVPREDEGLIDRPLEVRRRARSKRRAPVEVGTGKGKEAITRWRVEERFGRHALLRVRPETGRQHQIRAHLSAVGHPLAVDRRYGGGEDLRLSDLKRDYRVKGGEEKPILGRLSLHAERLRFVGGVGPVETTAPLPRDLEVCLRQLRRYDPPR